MWPWSNTFPGPDRFQVSIPDETYLGFGEELSRDQMFLDGKAVLYKVNTATCIYAVTCFDWSRISHGQTLKGMLQVFAIARGTICTGYPIEPRTDQGSLFAFQRWKLLTYMIGVKLHLCSVRAYSSPGSEGRVHVCLSKIFKIIKVSNPDIPVYHPFMFVRWPTKNE